jgi:hypothetical protein
MRIMVSGNTRAVEEAARRGYADVLGVLVQPHQHNHRGFGPATGLHTVFDNAAFSNPDARAFWNLMVDGWDLAGAIDWIACPDVVCCHGMTLVQWHAFRAELEYEIGCVPVPLAFVLQNGVEDDLESVPWDDAAAVFLGGDDDFKLGAAGRVCARESQKRGKPLHVGRVNSVSRLLYCRDVLNAASCDGRNWSAFSSANDLMAAGDLLRTTASPFLFDLTAA